MIASVDGQWKVTIMDEDGTHGSCGRKVCWLAAVYGDAAPSHRTDLTFASPCIVIWFK